MADGRSMAAVLARLFQGASIVIFVVIAFAGVTAMAGGNVAVWIDSGGLPSIETGPHARMAIPISGTLAQQGAASVDRVRGLLRFEGGPATLRVANTVIVVLLLGAACWILREFSALFAALRKRQFFLPMNAARIRRVGWAVIDGEVVRAAIVCFETGYARDHFTREGTRLQDEASLTI